MKKLPTSCLKIVLGVGLVAGVGTVALNHDNIYNHITSNFKKEFAVASAINTENKVKKAGAVVEQAEKEVQEAKVKLNAANDELKKAEATKNEAAEAAKKADNAVQEANVAKEQAEKALKAAKTEEEKKAAQAKLDAAKAEQKRAEEAKKEADAKLKAAEEARLKAEEEARRAAEAKKEAEAKKKAAEEAKKKAEAEAAEVKETESKAVSNKTSKSNSTVANNKTQSTTKKNTTTTQKEESEEQGAKYDLSKHPEILDEINKKTEEQVKAIEEEAKKKTVEFHFYSTLNPLTVRLYDHDNYYTPSRCGETGSGCIWFAEFSCDLNQCVGFLDTHTNELKDHVIYAKRASIKEYTMEAPEARYGYKFKQWEIISDRKNITVNGETGIAYKYIAVYEKI